MAREQFTATNGFSLRVNWESLTSENEIIRLAWEKMIQSLQLLSLLLPSIPSLLLTKHLHLLPNTRHGATEMWTSVCCCPVLPVGFNFTSGPFADMNQAAFEGWTQTRAPLVIKCLNEAANWHGSLRVERGHVT